MSKTYASLSAINSRHLMMCAANLYSLAINKHSKAENGVGEALNGDPQDRQPRRRGLKVFFMVASVIVAGFFLVTFYFVFQLATQAQVKDAQLATLLQAKDVQLARSQEAISRIEKTLESLSREMTTSSREIVALRTDFQEVIKTTQGTGAQIVKLEKQIDVQNFNIANLVKAKDSLFGRVSALSEKVDRLDALFAPEG